MSKEEIRKKKSADKVSGSINSAETDKEKARLRARAQELAGDPRTRKYFDPDAYDLDAGIDRGEITEDDKRAILDNGDLFEDNRPYRDEYAEGGNEMDREYESYRTDAIEDFTDSGVESRYGDNPENPKDYSDYELEREMRRTHALRQLARDRRKPKKQERKTMDRAKAESIVDRFLSGKTNSQR